MEAYEIEEVFVVDEVLLGEQTAEGRVAQGVGFVRAELEHGNCIRGCEVQGARDLDIKPTINVTI